MADDSPWKPPSDGANAPDVPIADASPAPSLPEAAPVVPAPPVGAASPVMPSAPNLPPTPPPPPAPPTPEPHAAPWADAPAHVPQTIQTSSEPSKRSSRSKWFVGAAAASIVAVGAAGVFAVSNLTGTPQGGAATPEDLGLSLLSAIENEDVLGVVDVLSPGERDVFRDPLVDLVSELTRLEVLSDDADLARLLGVDVDLSNEVVTATSTNVPDITNIDLRADATITLDGGELPIGELITDNMPSDMLTELRGTRVTETDVLDVRFTAIEEDGRWYFSVFHTIAEIARADVAPGTLIPVQGIGADGADTPGAAFDGVLDSVENLDLTGLLRTLNPGEAAALQRYAPLFLEDAESVLDEVPLDWEITRREFRVDESGDTATVFLDAIEIEATVEDDSFTVEYADGCLRAEGGGESFEQCNTGAFDDELGILDEAPETQRLVDTLADAFADVEEVGLEMRRTDGLWYVSPITTGTEAFLTVLRALDRSELDAIIEHGTAAADEWLNGLFNDLPGAVADGGFIADDLVDDAFSDDSIVLDDMIVESASDRCYAETDPAAASACFDVAIASGELDAFMVPLAIRYPECGYEAAWGGELYGLSDEEFIGIVEAARPCFLDLVEQGEISEWELPSEIAYLECFEGRNWYQVFDDPEYDERYYDCLESTDR